MTQNVKKRIIEYIKENQHHIDNDSFYGVYMQESEFSEEDVDMMIEFGMQFILNNGRSTFSVNCKKENLKHFYDSFLNYPEPDYFL